MCYDIKEKVNILLIFLSNYEHEEERVFGFLAGGDYYIIKSGKYLILETNIQYRFIRKCG